MRRFFAVVFATAIILAVSGLITPAAYAVEGCQLNLADHIWYGLDDEQFTMRIMNQFGDEYIGELIGMETYLPLLIKLNPDRTITVRSTPNGVEYLTMKLRYNNDQDVLYGGMVIQALGESRSVGFYPDRVTKSVCPSAPVQY